jgi:hypothetical protein
VLQISEFVSSELTQLIFFITELKVGKLVCFLSSRHHRFLAPVVYCKKGLEPATSQKYLLPCCVTSYVTNEKRCINKYRIRGLLCYSTHHIVPLYCSHRNKSHRLTAFHLPPTAKLPHPVNFCVFPSSLAVDTNRGNDNNVMNFASEKL